MDSEKETTAAEIESNVETSDFDENDVDSPPRRITRLSRRESQLSALANRETTPVPVIVIDSKSSSTTNTPVKNNADSRKSSLDRSVSATPIKNGSATKNTTDTPPIPLRLTTSETKSQVKAEETAKAASGGFWDNLWNSLPSYKKHSLQSEEKNIQNEQTLTYAIICALIAMAVVVFFSYGEKPTVPIAPDTQNNNRNINLLIASLKATFPNQTRGFYSNVISCYENSIVRKRDPSIIMLVSEKNTARNSKCISERLLKFILNEYDTPSRDKTNDQLLIIDSHSLTSRESDVVKKQLDDNLVHIFSQLESKVALIRDIQHLPAQSMLLFYTYGDDETTAKYNGIIILLTYELNESISENKNKYLELTSDYAKLSKFVEKKLNEQWSPFIDYDQLQPLYTRIANNILFLNNEKACDEQ